MSTGIYNSSAVDNYILEQSRREQEITRTRSIENYIKEAPYVLLVWGGRLFAVALLIMCIGWAISNALSFDRNTSNITKTMGGMSHSTGENNEFGSDDTINIDELLRGSQSKGEEPDLSEFNDNAEVTDDPNIVRDYYIFEFIDIDVPGINQIIIGRVYADPSSPSHRQYCYVDMARNNGTKNTFYLINILDDIRSEKSITDEVAMTLGTTVSALQIAKTHCPI